MQMLEMEEESDAVLASWAYTPRRSRVTKTKTASIRFSRPWPYTTKIAFTSGKAPAKGQTCSRICGTSLPALPTSLVKLSLSDGGFILTTKSTWITPRMSPNLILIGRDAHGWIEMKVNGL